MWAWQCVEVTGNGRNVLAFTDYIVSRERTLSQMNWGMNETIGIYREFYDRS